MHLYVLPEAKESRDSKRAAGEGLCEIGAPSHEDRKIRILPVKWNALYQRSRQLMGESHFAAP